MDVDPGGLSHPEAPADPGGLSHPEAPADPGGLSGPEAPADPGGLSHPEAPADAGGLSHPEAPADPGGPGEAPILLTSRLLLRRWRADDDAPFAVLNADPAVMEFFAQVLTRPESDRLARYGDGLFGRYGYGLWAVETLGDGRFIGFVGLSAVEADDPFPYRPFPFAPTVEVGWRLAHEAWGNGYAPEAAQECLRFGFESIGLSEIVSFTSEVNARSRRVMEKIGMHRAPDDDFDHPRFSSGDRLVRHVLYRLRRDEWRAAASDAGATEAGVRSA